MKGKILSHPVKFQCRQAADVFHEVRCSPELVTIHQSNSDTEVGSEDKYNIKVFISVSGQVDCS
jgi:hypothetical protein